MFGIWWRLKTLENDIAKRNRLAQCARCESFYRKTEQACPHCAELSDQEVAKRLEQTTHVMRGYGTRLYWLMLVFVLVALVFAWA